MINVPFFRCFNFRTPYKSQATFSIVITISKKLNMNFAFYSVLFIWLILSVCVWNFQWNNYYYHSYFYICLILDPLNFLCCGLFSFLLLFKYNKDTPRVLCVLDFHHLKNWLVHLFIYLPLLRFFLPFPPSFFFFLIYFIMWSFLVIDT